MLQIALHHQKMMVSRQMEIDEQMEQLKFYNENQRNLKQIFLEVWETCTLTYCY